MVIGIAVGIYFYMTPSSNSSSSSNTTNNNPNPATPNPRPNPNPRPVTPSSITPSPVTPSPVTPSPVTTQTNQPTTSNEPPATGAGASAVDKPVPTQASATAQAPAPVSGCQLRFSTTAGRPLAICSMGCSGAANRMYENSTSDSGRVFTAKVVSATQMTLRLQQANESKLPDELDGQYLDSMSFLYTSSAPMQWTFTKVPSTANQWNISDGSMFWSVSSPNPVELSSSKQSFVVEFKNSDGNSWSPLTRFPGMSRTDLSGIYWDNKRKYLARLIRSNESTSSRNVYNVRMWSNNGIDRDSSSEIKENGFHQYMAGKVFQRDDKSITWEEANTSESVEKLTITGERNDAGDLVFSTRTFLFVTSSGSVLVGTSNNATMSCERYCESMWEDWMRPMPGFANGATCSFAYGTISGAPFQRYGVTEVPGGSGSQLLSFCSNRISGYRGKMNLKTKSVVSAGKLKDVAARRNESLGANQRLEDAHIIWATNPLDSEVSVTRVKFVFEYMHRGRAIPHVGANPNDSNEKGTWMGVRYMGELSNLTIRLNDQQVASRSSTISGNITDFNMFGTYLRPGRNLFEFDCTIEFKAGVVFQVYTSTAGVVTKLFESSPSWVYIDEASS